MPLMLLFYSRKSAGEYNKSFVVLCFSRVESRKRNCLPSMVQKATCKCSPSADRTVSGGATSLKFIFTIGSIWPAAFLRPVFIWFRCLNLGVMFRIIVLVVFIC